MLPPTKISTYINFLFAFVVCFSFLRLGFPASASPVLGTPPHATSRQFFESHRSCLTAEKKGKQGLSKGKQASEVYSEIEKPVPVAVWGCLENELP